MAERLTGGVLFVCLGNICRSPLAEAAFRAACLTARITVETDSAGTGDWHVGAPPDPRAIVEAARHGIDITGYRARQVTVTDFRRFETICALDGKNLSDLRALRPADGMARLSLLLDHVPGMVGCSVDDPYWGGPEDFARTWDEVTRAAHALVAQYAQGHSRGP